MKRSELVLWVVAALASVTIAFLYAGIGNRIANAPGVSDYYKFYWSAQRALEGGSSYWTVHDMAPAGVSCEEGDDLDIAFKSPVELTPEEVRRCLHPNLNPPAFTALMLPFATVPYPHSWWAWTIASMICAMTAVGLVVRERLRERTSPLGVVLAIVALFAWFPTASGVMLGQVGLFLLLPVALGWIALRNGAQTRAGAWLGVAFALKPFFGLFLVTLALHREWRACAALLVAFVAVGVFGGVVLGFGEYLNYVETLAEVTWGANSWNASASGFFVRVLGGSRNEPWVDAPVLARTLSTLFSAIVLFLLHRSASRVHGGTMQPRADALFALTIPAMLLISPLGWVYYFPLLCITGTVAWRLADRTTNPVGWRLALGIPFAMTLLPRPLILAEEIEPGFIGWLWHGSAYFYALAGLFFVASALHLRTSRLPREASAAMQVSRG